MEARKNATATAPEIRSAFAVLPVTERFSDEPRGALVRLSVGA